VIVVDTNVIVSFCLRADATELARKAMRKDADWIAPPLWLSEMRDVLATLMRVRALGYDNALTVLAEAEDLMAAHTYATSSRRIMEIARDSGLSAYDSEFVALALDAGTELVTLDKRLAMRFPRVATPLDRFVGA
jgi:predicted nucleic acid-binding protein